jgi:hypothetical protein
VLRPQSGHRAAPASDPARHGPSASRRQGCAFRRLPRMHARAAPSCWTTAHWCWAGTDTAPRTLSNFETDPTNSWTGREGLDAAGRLFWHRVEASRAARWGHSSIFGLRYRCCSTLRVSRASSMALFTGLYSSKTFLTSTAFGSAGRSRGSFTSSGRRRGRRFQHGDMICSSYGPRSFWLRTFAG